MEHWPTTKRKSSGNLQLTVVIFGWVWYWLGWVCPIGEPGSCKRLNWHGGVGRVSDGSLNQTTNARVVGDYRPAPPYTQWTVINARWYPLVSKLAKILFSRNFFSSLTCLASRVGSSPWQISSSPLLSQPSTSPITNATSVTNNMVVFEVSMLAVAIMNWSDSSWNHWWYSHIIQLYQCQLHPGRHISSH